MLILLRAREFDWWFGVRGSAPDASARTQEKTFYRKQKHHVFSRPHVFSASARRCKEMYGNTWKWDGRPTGTWDVFSASAKCFFASARADAGKTFSGRKKHSRSRRAGRPISRRFHTVPCICGANAEKTCGRENRLFLFQSNIFSWVRADASGAELRTPNYTSNSRTLRQSLNIS